MGDGDGGSLDVAQTAQPPQLVVGEAFGGISLRQRLLLGPLTPGRQLFGELFHNVGVPGGDVGLVKRILRSVEQLEFGPVGVTLGIVDQLPAVLDNGIGLFPLGRMEGRPFGKRWLLCPAAGRLSGLSDPYRCLICARAAGSPGDEKLYLIGMIDDASSELLARFVPHDSSEENRRLLRTYVEQNGRPVAVYTDRAGMFVNTPKNSAGEDPKDLPLTQIGRALEELGIEPITAYSPQAKGRVERSFGTAQDRLVKGLRLAGATTTEQANAYLESEFLPWWNTTLRVTPAHPDEAHRQLGPEHNLDSALSHVEARRVANDYTIRFQRKLYQIDRKAIVPGLRGGKVRLESGLDGKLVARFGKHELALRRCLTRPESKDAEKKAAAVEKAPGPVPRRKGSDWMKDFDLKKSPPLWLAAQASGIRRDEAQADALS